MSARPDIAAVLDADEALLWRGHPSAGRRSTAKATALGALFYVATIAFVILGWWVEIFRGHVPVWHLVVYAVIAAAAFTAYLGLRVTLLDRRRARARDARTAYAITDRRALAIAGPYRSEVRLGPEVTADLSGDLLLIDGPAAHLRFERLDDAARARDILNARIRGNA